MIYNVYLVVRSTHHSLRSEYKGKINLWTFVHSLEVLMSTQNCNEGRRMSFPLGKTHRVIQPVKERMMEKVRLAARLPYTRLIMLNITMHVDLG